MKIVPIAKALVLDSGGRMLMLRRSDTHPTLAGRRDLPGGLIDAGEEPGDAVIREIMEETALVVQKPQLQILYAGTEAHDEESRVRLLYLVKLDVEQPEVTISWEHGSAEWVDMNELESIEDDFHAFYHDALHYARTHHLLGV